MVKRFRLHILTSFAVVGLSSAAAIAAPQQGQDQNKVAHPLPWAYAVVDVPPPPAPPRTDDEVVKQIPGSTQSFTMKQLRDFNNPVDWFPATIPQCLPSWRTVSLHRPHH